MSTVNQQQITQRSINTSQTSITHVATGSVGAAIQHEHPLSATNTQSQQVQNPFLQSQGGGLQGNQMPPLYTHSNQQYGVIPSDQYNNQANTISSTQSSQMVVQGMNAPSSLPQQPNKYKKRKAPQGQQAQQNQLQMSQNSVDNNDIALSTINSNTSGNQMPLQLQQHQPMNTHNNMQLPRQIEENSFLKLHAQQQRANTQNSTNTSFISQQEPKDQNESNLVNNSNASQGALQPQQKRPQSSLQPQNQSGLTDQQQSSNTFLIRQSQVTSSLNYSESVNQQQQNQPSSLVKQLSEKVRAQAERLQQLERSNQELQDQLKHTNNHHSDISGYSLDAKDGQKDAIIEEQKLKIEQLQQEKDALLDYIEEKIEKNGAPGSITDRSRQTMNSARNQENLVKELQEQIKTLQFEKQTLFQMNENLKYSEGMSRQKVLELQDHISSQSNSNYNKNSASKISQMEQENTQPNLKVAEENQQLKHQIQNLEQNLTEIQQRYNSKCEDYASIVRQIDPNFQENTFGNIEEFHVRLQEIGQDLNQSKEQFESTKANLKQEKENYQKQVEILEQQVSILQQELSSKNTKIDTQRQNDSDNSSRIDELMHQNDNLQKELDQAHEKIKLIQENAQTLSQTLHDTQQELESLVNDHEKLSRDYQEQATLLQQYQQQSIDKVSQEMHMGEELKKELDSERIEFNKQLNSFKEANILQKEEITAKNMQINQLSEQLKLSQSQCLKFKSQIEDLQNQLDAAQQSNNEEKKWESTINDLQTEFNNIQGEITQKDQQYIQIEQELKCKLVELQQHQNDKTKLECKIGELNQDIEIMRDQNRDKHEQLREQIQKNDELLRELEKLNVMMQTMKDEKEHTLAKEKNHFDILEDTQQIVKMQVKIIKNCYKRLKHTHQMTSEFSKEFKIQMPQNSQIKRYLSKEDLQAEDLQNEALFKEIESISTYLGEWINVVAHNYRAVNQQANQHKVDYIDSQAKLDVLESKYAQLKKKEAEAREKILSFIEEQGNLKEQLKLHETQNKDGFYRQEKVMKQNQQIKVQLEQTRKEQEKLLIQIKSLLAEKEHLQLDFKQKVDLYEMELSKIQNLEIALNQQKAQKDMILKMLDRVQSAMPSESLQQIFTDMLDSVHEIFYLDEQYQSLEQTLMSMESELRSYAKRQDQNYLLSTKVINLRKDVDKNRHKLNQLQEERQASIEKRENLEDQLRQIEVVEKRRNDVAVETEKTVIDLKEEVNEFKKELQFVNNNRSDLEMALKSVQEEKKMIERELMSIRNQLQMGPSSFSQKNQPTLTVGAQSALGFQGGTTHSRTFAGSQTPVAGAQGDFLDMNHGQTRSQPGSSLDFHLPLQSLTNNNAHKTLEQSNSKIKVELISNHNQHSSEAHHHNAISFSDANIDPIHLPSYPMSNKNQNLPLSQKPPMLPLGKNTTKHSEGMMPLHQMHSTRNVGRPAHHQATHQQVSSLTTMDNHNPSRQDQNELMINKRQVITARSNSCQNIMPQIIQQNQQDFQSQKSGQNQNLIQNLNLNHQFKSSQAKLIQAETQSAGDQETQCNDNYLGATSSQGMVTATNDENTQYNGQFKNVQQQNLQRRLSQVKNVFQNIRKNLNANNLDSNAQQQNFIQ